jgi:hypothetical protein
LEIGRTDGRPVVRRAGLIRTARLLARGEVLIPAAVWNGQGRQP